MGVTGVPEGLYGSRLYGSRLHGKIPWDSDARDGGPGWTGRERSPYP